MKLKQYKKKMQLKKDLMVDAGKYFEDLCDYDEPAKVLKAKDFARKSRKSFMKDYKKALALIDKEFADKTSTNTAVAEAKSHQTKKVDKLSNTAEEKKADNPSSPANDALKA